MAYSSAANKIIDPLSFHPLRIGTVVELKSDNGVFMKFKIIRIEDDESVVLKRPESKLVAIAHSDEVVINPKMVVGKFGVRPGDKVMVKYGGGGTERFVVDFIFNNDLMIISKPGRKKLSLLERIKLLWKARSI